MEFLALEWSDFKSFVGEHRLDFSRYTPGLYFLRGENQVEPELGSNGAAKSTLLDVISWILFGRSMRGIRSPDLVPWKPSDRPRASLRLRIDKTTTTIRRTYRPTHLTITRKGGKETPITQEQLDDLIGLTPAVFENSIVIGQFTRLFFDLKPREKMNIFTSLLDLDYWLVCSENASSTLGVIEDDVHETQHKVDIINTRIEEIQRTIVDLERDQETSAESIRVKVAEVEGHKRSLDIKRRTVKKKIFKIKKLHTKTKKLQKQAKKAEDGMNETMLLIRKQLSSLSSSVQVQNILIAERRKQERQLKRARNTCPTCGQRISAAHRRKELAKIGKEKHELESKFQSLEKDYVVSNRAENETQHHLTNAHTEETRLRLKVENYTLDLNQLQHKESSLTTDIQNCDNTLTDLEQRKSDSANKLRKQQTRLTKLKSERREERRALRELQQASEQVRFWIRGFKEIRLYELEETLVSLQTEINSYLIDLGMENWSVHLDSERETKSGKISRGFQMMVDPGTGDNRRARPWEVWSGGEGQRIRLAGTLALSNLILKQFNRSSNLQIWDEALIWLSGSGKTDMLELLQETAHREQKQIWVIDQSDLSFPFDGTITVVKDRNGSRLKF